MGAGFEVLAPAAGPPSSAAELHRPSSRRRSWAEAAAGTAGDVGAPSRDCSADGIVSKITCEVE